MERVDTDALTWNFFLTASIESAVRLGKDYEDNLRVKRNTEFSEIRTFFSITQKLDYDPQDEIL